MLSKRQLYILVYFAALIGVAAYQPFNIWPGALVFIAILLFTIKDKSPKQAFIIGYAFGVIFYITLLYWIAWATFFGALPVPFILALVPAFFCWLFRKIELANSKIALILAPFIWVALEYIRTLGQVAFPWNPIGNCFATYPEFIQYAEFTGVYGISLWASVINILFYIFFKNPANLKRTFAYLGAIIFLIVTPYLYGLAVIPEEIKEGDIEVALLQGDISREVKWKPGGVQYSFNTYKAMTDSVSGSEAKLIIWPETAIPSYLRHHRGYNRRMLSMAGNSGTPILTGSPDYTEIAPRQYVYYNSALFYHPDKSSPEIYRKIKLVPFSERIPFSGRVKILKDIHLGQADFSPGDSLMLFELDGNSFGVLICFELVFPDLVRRYMKRGADFMVTITNDMWFGVTSGPYQHLYAGTIRAVENRVGIARCANTGISLFYDTYGRVYNMTELNERKIVVDKVAINKGSTFYMRHGDFLAKWSLIVAILSLFAILLRDFINRRNKI
ncbi:MAG: apolipoprotein N-acyltransferase [candidate division Zixibacteria bacterium]|nr:apolipoprotein N-acyltransferase [candidate division Zixibacteria bacterium]